MKRILAGSLLVASTAVALAAAPAGAATASPAKAVDRSCAGYPAGVKYVFAASPSTAKVNYGSRIKPVASLTAGPKKQACGGFLVSGAGNLVSSSARTGSTGNATFTTLPVQGPQGYVFTVNTGRKSLVDGISVTVSYPAAASKIDPVISKLSSTSGSIKGGQTLTITGKGLTYATAVYFRGAAAQVASWSKDGKTITVVVPAHDKGTVPVSVNSPGGLSNKLTYTYKK